MLRRMGNWRQTVGIIGAGQLARMLIEAATPLDIEIVGVVSTCQAAGRHGINTQGASGLYAEGAAGPGRVDRSGDGVRVGGDRPLQVGRLAAGALGDSCRRLFGKLLRLAAILFAVAGRRRKLFAAENRKNGF